MTKLVKITKVGEPDLKIHPEALEQHVNLGWTDCGEAEDEPEESGGSEVVASAAAKKLAEDNGLDLSTVTGSGDKGQITKPDVQKAIDAIEAAKKAE